jgi:hypothetical protein
MQDFWLLLAFLLVATAVLGICGWLLSTRTLPPTQNNAEEGSGNGATVEPDGHKIGRWLLRIRTAAPPRPIFVVPSATEPVYPSPPPSPSWAAFFFSTADKQASLGGTASATFVVQIGWALVISGVLPLGYQYVFQEWPISALGRWINYAPLMPIGGITLGLGIAPQDAWTIRATARALAILYFSLTILCTMATAHYYQRLAVRAWPYTAVWGSLTALNLFSGLAIVQRLRALHGHPDKLLRAEWAVGRFSFCAAGLSVFAFGGCMLYIDFVLNANDPYAPSAAATALAFAACGGLATPAARDRVTRLLAGSSGSTDPNPA